MKQRIIAIFLVFLVSMVFSSCMVSIRIEPDGFVELIEEFDLFEVSVRHVYYSPPSNNLGIALDMHSADISMNDIKLLRDIIAEYLRSANLLAFWKAVGRILIITH